MFPHFSFSSCSHHHWGSWCCALALLVHFLIIWKYKETRLGSAENTTGSPCHVNRVEPFHKPELHLCVFSSFLVKGMHSRMCTAQLLSTQKYRSCWDDEADFKGSAEEPRLHTPSLPTAFFMPSTPANSFCQTLKAEALQESLDWLASPKLVTSQLMTLLRALRKEWGFPQLRTFFEPQQKMKYFTFFLWYLIGLAGTKCSVV